MVDSGALWQPAPEQGPAPGWRYGNVLERVLATLIDYFVVVFVGGIPYGLVLELTHAERGSTGELLASLIVLVVVVVVFGVTVGVWNGQSIGGRVLGLHIVDRRDGRPIDMGRSLLRVVGLFVTFMFSIVSLILVSVGRERRTPADLLVGSVVIHRRKDGPTRPTWMTPQE